MSTLAADIEQLHAKLSKLEELCSCTRAEMTPARAGTYRAAASSAKRLSSSITRQTSRPPGMQSSEAKRERQQQIQIFTRMDSESKLAMLDSLFVHGQFADLERAVQTANEVALQEEEDARAAGRQRAMGSGRQQQATAQLQGPGQQREDLWADELQALERDAGALASIYEEFGVLIESQQDVIDGIDERTAATVDDLILGFEQLGQHQKAATWKRYKLRWTTGGAAVGGVVGAIGGAGVGAVLGAGAGGTLGHIVGGSLGGIVRMAVDREADSVTRQLVARGMTLRRPPTSRKEAEAQWEHASSCSCCTLPFSSMNRWKYHCHNCFKSVCDAHSSARLRVEFYREPARVCDRCARTATDAPPPAAGLLDDWVDRDSPRSNPKAAAAAPAAGAAGAAGLPVTGAAAADQWATADRARRDRERLGLPVGPRSAGGLPVGPRSAQPGGDGGARSELFAGAADRPAADGTGRVAARGALRSMERSVAAGSAAAATLSTQGETLGKVQGNANLAEEVAARSARVQNSGGSIFGAIGTLFSRPALTSDQQRQAEAEAGAVQVVAEDDGSAGGSAGPSSSDARFAATLDAMGTAMSQSRGLAVGMRDAVVQQNGQIKRIETATDAAQTHIDTVNRKMDRSKNPTKVKVSGPVRAADIN